MSKRPDSRHEQFERRVPQDIVKLARGKPVIIELPPLRGVKGTTVHATLGDKVKFSLRTTDGDVAQARRCLVLAHLEKLYDAIRQGPRPLSQKEIVAYSGEIYRLYVQRFDENPGSPEAWGAFKALNRAVLEGRISQAPPIIPGEVNDRQNAAALFGDDLTMGIDALPRSEPSPAALEQRFGLLASWVLARHGLEIDAETRVKLLQEVGRAAQDAGWRYKRASADSDYSLDPAEKRFPPVPSPGSSSKTGLLDLFEGWARERRPSAKTVDEWRKYIEAFIAFAKEDDARQIRKATVVAWKDALLASGLKSKTINDAKLAALRKAFAWGEKNERITGNPAAGVAVDYTARMEDDMEGFTDEEAETILVAAAKETGRPPIYWIPLLCATSGARVGEIAQLRGEDVFERDGMPVMQITNEAGSVKNRNASRVLPIHPAVVEAGFLGFVGNRSGPLFFGVRRRKPDARKPPHKIVAKNVAAWVGSLGLKVGRKEYRKDPNHAWRHRFTTLCRATDVNDSVIDLIKGNAPDSVSRGYGTATLRTMLRAIETIPVPAAALKAYTAQAREG